jgi:ASPIC/UnbV protein/VCBS repeat protein/flagellar hook capping protein FlgD/pre-peptidase
MIKTLPRWCGILLGLLCLPHSALATKPGYPVRLSWSVPQPFVAGEEGQATLIITSTQFIERIQVVPTEEARLLIVGDVPSYDAPLTASEPLSIPVRFTVPRAVSPGLAFRIVVDGQHGTYRLGASLDITPQTARPFFRPGTPTPLGERTIETSSRPLTASTMGPASALGDSVTFSGRFLYRDRVFGPEGFLHADPADDPVKPIRFASVDLLVEGSSLPVASAVTDSLGAFLFTVMPQPTAVYRVRILSTTSPFWGGSTLRVRTSSAQNGAYFSATTPTQNNVIGNVNWGDQIVEPGAAEGFNLLDCIIEGARQVELLTGSLPATNLNVFWNPASTNGTYFTLNNSSIYLLGDEGYDDCVVLHEFGHFVAAHYSKDDSPGGEHFVDDDTQDPRLAWSEGFASYFQASVRKRLGDSYPSWYVDTWGTPGAGQLLFSYDLEGASLTGQGTPDNRVVFQGIYVRGTGSEVVVQALLWDVEDGANTPGDSEPGVDDDALELGPESTWAVLSGPLHAAAAVSLEDFWDGWFALDLRHEAGMQAVFGALGAEYFADSFEDDDSAAQSKPFLANGLSVHHTFYPSADVDVHSVHLAAGAPVLVETSNIESYGDTYLEVTNGDSTWSSEDRSPGDMSSAVQFTPPVTGDYTVRVQRSYHNPESQITNYGSYDLRAVPGVPTQPILTQLPNSAADPGFSVGVAMADADLDDRPDIYVVNNSGCTPEKGKDAFYHNDGDLNFSNQTGASGFGTSEGGIAAAWGDYDRDGDPDLFVSDHGLYQNNGHGVFTDVTTSSGVVDIGREYDASWVDTDGDGWLDLFVLRRDGPSALWRNQHDGTFINVTAQTGLVFPEDGGSAIGCAWADYDGDLKPDLFIARRSQDAQALFHNLGGNQFEDVTVAAGLSSDIPAAGGVWGDVSGDGRPDLFVASSGPDRLYVNNGNGTFTDQAHVYGVDVAAYNTGAGLFDIDLDGDLDLFASTLGGGQFLFRNLGTTMARAADASETGLGYGMTAGDLNQDGAPEVYQAIGCDGGSCACGANRLYQNLTSGKHRLGVKLVGDASNMDGIGSRVVVHAGAMKQVREMGSGNGWASKSLLPLVFGLGDSAEVDSVEVFWPSGARNLVTAPAGDQVITVVENTHVPVLPPEPEVPFRMVLLGPTPNPFRGGTTLVLELTQPARVFVSIYDVTGRKVRTLVDRVMSAGTQYVGWDGTDDFGRHAGRGLYFYRAQAGDRTEVRKLMALGH